MTKPNWSNITVKVKKILGVNVVLCTSCKWDWRGACHNEARPNAIYCRDYQKRGR